MVKADETNEVVQLARRVQGLLTARLAEHKSTAQERDELLRDLEECRRGNEALNESLGTRDAELRNDHASLEAKYRKLKAERDKLVLDVEDWISTLEIALPTTPEGVEPIDGVSDGLKEQINTAIKALKHKEAELANCHASIAAKEAELAVHKDAQNQCDANLKEVGTIVKALERDLNTPPPPPMGRDALMLQAKPTANSAPTGETRNPEVASGTVEPASIELNGDTPSTTASTPSGPASVVTRLAPASSAATKTAAAETPAEAAATKTADAETWHRARDKQFKKFIIDTFGENVYDGILESNGEYRIFARRVNPTVNQMNEPPQMVTVVNSKPDWTGKTKEWHRGWEFTLKVREPAAG